MFCQRPPNDGERFLCGERKSSFLGGFPDGHPMYHGPFDPPPCVPFGKIDGAGNWNKTNVNLCHLLLTK